MNLYFISLGCDKNLVDSKFMIDLLSRHGHRIVDDVRSADAAIVNTCCFIQSATEESIQAILEMAAEKENGHLKAVVAAGCMAGRYREQIAEELPEVDALIDTHSIEEAARILEELEIETEDDSEETAPSAVLTGPGHYGYLKIADGCDKHCTYCVIPSIRGPYRSVPMEELLQQARRMADEGVRELILVAQETTLYGVDLYGEKMLPGLLERLCEIDGIVWIRILYCYPEEITDGLIECMKSHEKICHYIDMPIQHADDGILGRMGRRTNQDQIRRVIRDLRREIPDIVIRTSLITGFPGESEEQHRELVHFLEEMNLERVGIFAYSQEEGTPAADMPEQISEEVKDRRLKELYEAQQALVFEQNESLAGTEIEVLIEGALTGESDVYAGRSYRDAPQVDGLVFVKSGERLETGDLVRVVIDGSSGYDLTGFRKEDMI